MDLWSSAQDWSDGVDHGHLWRTKLVAVKPRAVSERRILTTHTGRLPNPPTISELLAARAHDPAKFDELVQGGVADLVRKQMALKNDLHSDGELWKARDQRYYDSRATGVTMQPVTTDKPAWLLAHQRERQLPEFREFYEIYDAVGNTPMPGVTLPPATYRAVVTGPWAYRGPGAIQHEIAVVKAGIAAAGANVEDFSFPCSAQGGSPTSSGTSITRRKRRISMPWPTSARATTKPWWQPGLSSRSMIRRWSPGLAWPTHP